MLSSLDAQRAEIERAAADPRRVEMEISEWRKNPDAYVSRRFAELAAWDFPVWCAGNIRIQTKRGKSIPFRLNRIQRRLWDWLLEDLINKRPVRWFILKARQEGVSTFALALCLWLTSLRANRTALVCTHDEASVHKFNSRLRAMYAGSHPLLKPETQLDRRDILHFGNKTSERKKGAGAGLDSSIMFATAQRQALGHSYNFHAMFLSEICLWPEVGIDVGDALAGLYPAIVDAPGTIIILESTAKGENKATQLLLDPKNGYRHIFIPHAAFDEYRKPLRKGETLGELSQTDESRYGNEAEEARLIREVLPVWYPEEVAKGGERWIEEDVVARLNWRRSAIDGESLGDLQRFRHEYPACLAHALSTSAKNLFDYQSLREMRAYVEDEGLTPIRCRLVQDDDEPSPNRKFHRADGYGKVYFYRMPGEFERASTSFVIGADTSMGLSASADPSAAIVLAVSADETEEVASFNSVIAPDAFAEMLFWLGRLYDDALLAVEHNERGGAVVNDYLQKVWRYPRLYFPRDMFTGKVKRDTVAGFVTTADGKSKLVEQLAADIRDHAILFRSIELIKQLQSYQELPNGKLGAPSGAHDDFVSAALIARHMKKHIHRFQSPREAIPRGSFAWEAHRLARQRGLRVPGV